ncbi:NAD(P)H-dependent oxidoreductase subunit E [Caloramator sp. E03]|nr:NAD(P)H-dependent oxidoreductase subunit E [Caloramator sp. E03]
MRFAYSLWLQGANVKEGGILSNIMEIIKKYPREKRYTLAMLQDVQKHFNYIPRQALEMISEYVNTPLSNLYSMATFYKALSLKPKGKYVIKVCDGTACHIRSSMVLIDEIYNILKIRPGETTEDGMFSLETVNCLGSCAIAPVMVVNDKYYGKVSPAMVREIIKEYGGEKNE